MSNVLVSKWGLAAWAFGFVLDHGCNGKVEPHKGLNNILKEIGRHGEFWRGIASRVVG